MGQPNAIRRLTAHVLTAADIEEVLTFRRALAATQKRLKGLEENLKIAEDAIIFKLEEGGSPVVPGFSLTVTQMERRFPAWKEHYISEMGQKAADRVLKNTEPKIYHNLIIKKAG